MKRPGKKKVDDFRKCIIGISGCKCNMKAVVYNACCDDWEKFLPSEDEIGFLMFMAMTKFKYEEAKEYWTGKHIQMATKTLSSVLAKVLAKRLGVK